MNGRHAAIITTALLLAVSPLLGFGAAPADAHGTHITAGPQVSADGTVVVEEAFLLERGYLVIHENDGGEPGEIIGHTALGEGYHRGVTVSLDESWWADAAETESVVAVLHRDDESGDEFEPEVDTPLSSFGSVAGAEFAVRNGDSPVNVIASSFSGHPVQDTVTVPRTRLADEGYLVVRANDDGEPGEVVGHQSLEAGTHESATVPVDRDALPTNGTNVYLWVTVYRDDGDGAFDAENDDPVTVAESPVQSRIVAVLNATEEDMSVGVNTPESTTTDPATSEDTTSPSDGEIDGTTGGSETDDATGGNETGMPAVGVVGTLVAVLAGILLAVRRR
jgi:hypothetical protein